VETSTAYPDGNCYYLARGVAKKLGVSPDASSR